MTDNRTIRVGSKAEAIADIQMHSNHGVGKVFGGSANRSTINRALESGLVKVFPSIASDGSAHEEIWFEVEHAESTWCRLIVAEDSAVADGVMRLVGE